MDLVTALIIIVIVLVAVGVPWGRYRGYHEPGLLGLVVIIVLVWALFGRH